MNYAALSNVSQIIRLLMYFASSLKIIRVWICALVVSLIATPALAVSYDERVSGDFDGMNPKGWQLDYGLNTFSGSITTESLGVNLIQHDVDAFDFVVPTGTVADWTFSVDALNFSSSSPVQPGWLSNKPFAFPSNLWWLATQDSCYAEDASNAGNPCQIAYLVDRSISINMDGGVDVTSGNPLITDPYRLSAGTYKLISFSSLLFMEPVEPNSTAMLTMDYIFKVQVSAVPEADTIFLFGVGLVLIVYRRISGTSVKRG